MNLNDDDIRNIFNEGNHSVHINDTKEETIRLAKCLLNKNSVHFLNNSKEEAKLFTVGSEIAISSK